MKTLTWQEAYSNLILDDFLEDKIRELEHAKQYRKLNYIKGKIDPEENKKKPAGVGIRVIESEKYKKLMKDDCPYTKATANWYNSEEDLNKYGENPF
tara:strand:- start:396 stop:686 length:291 start_codon:yes stop_codon:yes gene_type:complete